MLTLAEALRTDRLSEFVAQQEAAGLPPADRDAFENIVRAAVKPPTAARQTSNSRRRGSSTDSKTPQGKAAASRG